MASSGRVSVFRLAFITARAAGLVGICGGPPVSFDGISAGVQRSSGWALNALTDELNPPEPDEWPSGQHRKWLDAVPPGENYLCLTKERGYASGPFRYRSRYWSFLLKLHPDRPASTIRAQRVTYNGPFHWSGRHLRIRELARLQGFADWQPLAEDLSLARRHVGNAVPPLMGAAVVHHMLVNLGLMESAHKPEALSVASSPDLTFEQLGATFPPAIVTGSSVSS